jgi:hypothetical protein
MSLRSRTTHHGRHPVSQRPDKTRNIMFNASLPRAIVTAPQNACKVPASGKNNHCMLRILPGFSTRKSGIGRMSHSTFSSPKGAEDDSPGQRPGCHAEKLFSPEGAAQMTGQRRSVSQIHSL